MGRLWIPLAALIPTSASASPTAATSAVSTACPKPAQPSPKPQISLALMRLTRFVSAAVPLGIHKLRLTGGEPLLRPKLPDLVAKLSAIRRHPRPRLNHQRRPARRSRPALARRWPAPLEHSPRHAGPRTFPPHHAAATISAASSPASKPPKKPATTSSKSTPSPSKASPNPTSSRSSASAATTTSKSASSNSCRSTRKISGLSTTSSPPTK